MRAAATPDTPMPGLVAILAPQSSPDFLDQLGRMIGCLRHGPAAAGVLVEAPLGLYAGWVAHPGSQAALQCKAESETPTAVLLSGECHGAGPSLEAAFDAEGAAFVDRLDGAFAGLVLDRRRGEAWIFNDRFGMERLYTAEAGGVTYVASEAKALLAVLPRARAFDDRGVAQYLSFGSTLGGRTLFRGIELLPGGSLLHRGAQRAVSRQRYFIPRQWEALPMIDEQEFQARFDEMFPRLVARETEGTQLVGLSITGGLDTRMISASLPNPAPHMLAYTYAAEGNDRLLDLTIGRRVAVARSMPHHVLRVGENFLRDFADHLDRTVWVTDGTAGVLGTHELVLSEQARTLAPVRLTGNFGSEVLRSMSTFKRSGPDDAILDPSWRARVAEVVAEQEARTVHPVTHAAFEEVPGHLAGLPAASRSQLTVRTPYMANELVQLAYRAPPSLRCTSQLALRFLHRRDPALAALPTDRGVAYEGVGAAAQLRRLYLDVTFKLDYWYSHGMPHALSPLDGLIGATASLDLLGLHKFLSYRTWFRQQLAPHAASVAADGRTRAMPFWNTASLKAMATDHAAGRSNRLRDIHAVLTLEAVQRNLIDSAVYESRAPKVAAGVEQWTLR